jgi:Rieske 2Fe-2S family protein
VVRLDCNWKLAPENLADWYHVEVLHRGSLGSYTPTEKVRFEQFDRGSYAVRYSSGSFAPEGKSLFGPMPWLKSRGESFAFSFYLRPNLSFFARTDGLAAFTAWPAGPDACDLCLYLLFPSEWFEQADFASRAKVYSDWFKGFLQEDVDIVASLQRGLKSRRFEPGPMVALEEPIHHMLNDYLDRVFGQSA